MRPLARTTVLGMLLLGLCAVPSAPVLAGEKAAEDELRAKSLPLRTALHHDPTMTAPFDRLLALYREANRVGDLLEIYRTHLTKYPKDAAASTVLIRLLTVSGDPEALGVAQRAVTKHGEDAYLRFLLYQILRSNHDPAALRELDRAIECETLPGRKRAWIDILLPEADAQDRRDLSEKHLRALAASVAGKADPSLEVARKMIRFEFHKLALETLAKAAKASPPPETTVEIEMAAASAEVGLSRMRQAAARLERLLSKLTADYWRRPEILRRRIALVKAGSERTAMLEAARKEVAAKPNNEAAALDLAELLAGFELRRDALKALLEAGRRMPASARIEKATLEVFDRLRDERGREKYLAERVKAFPDRKDLVFARIKSLFLFGRRKEARSQLDGLVAKMEPAAQVRHLLDMARYLRRSNLTSDASAVFERVVKLAPARIDVRRELAETYTATGKPEQARELFAKALPKDTEMENLLDIIPFMIEQGMLREARTALRARLEQAATNLDLRILLLRIEARLGGQTTGEKLILETRKVADTAARYRRWLEAAVAFHDAFDTLAEFLESEQARIELERGEWTGTRLERRLVFADVAARNGRQTEVAALIKNDLDEKPPPKVRIKLRRRLVAVLQEDKAQQGAVEEQLKALAKDDPKGVDEYHARLAVLYAKSERHQLVPPLLHKINIAGLRDPTLLGRLQQFYARYGGGPKMLDILARLTVLDPTNRSHWERWLTALAATGDEYRLRSVIRKLLAGIDRMPLAEETRGPLQSHLVDSYWRSAAGLLADGKPAALADALAVLEAVERAAQKREQWLWVMWTRAFILNRLGRTKARDEAIKELERVAAAPLPGAKEGERPKKEGEEQPKEKAVEFIMFPDGLTVSLKRARAVLAAPPGKGPTPPRADRRGPLPKFRVKWVFDIGSQGAVTSILPLGGSRLLVRDLSGELYCLDSKTGKLLWEGEPPSEESPSSASVQVTHPAYYRSPYYSTSSVVWSGPAPPPVYYSSPRPYYGPGYSHQPPRPFLPPALATDGEGRIYIPGETEVDCLSVKDGRLLWRAELGAVVAGGPGGQFARAFVTVFAHKDRMLAYCATSGMAAAFDRKTGKLIWERSLPAQGNVPATWANSGASLSGRRLFVYGVHAAILDAETGEPEWSFEPSRVRKFPVKLKEPAAAAAAAKAPPAVPPYYSSYPGSRGYRGYYPSTPPPPVYLSHLQRSRALGAVASAPSARVALAAPAVVWAYGQSGQPRLGHVLGDRLLLFGQNGLLVVPLDLPLAGKRYSLSGTFVGMAGHVACLLQAGVLQTVDVTSGATRTYSLQEITRGQANARLQATVDGSLVYVTGPGGILCVNAKTNQRVFNVPWPKVLGPVQPSTAQHYAYQWQGVMAYHSHGQGPCIPMADSVGKGALYATVTPTRVVALVEREPDGR